MNEDICLDEYNAILQCIAGEFNDLIKDYFDRLCSDEPYLLIDKTKEEYIQEYKNEITKAVGVNIWNDENPLKHNQRKYVLVEPDNGIVTIPRNLLDDMKLCLTFISGLYCTDNRDIVEKINKEYWFQLDETKLLKKLEEYI